MSKEWVKVMTDETEYYYAGIDKVNREIIIFPSEQNIARLSDLVCSRQLHENNVNKVLNEMIKVHKY